MHFANFGKKTVLSALLGGMALGWGARPQTALRDIQITLLPTAQTRKTNWTYTTDDPGPGWETSGFAADTWAEGPGGFGASGPASTLIGTDWNSSDIWMRKSFQLVNLASLQNLAINVSHDEGAEIYLNGVPALQLVEHQNDYTLMSITQEALETLKEGENLIAVHCRNDTGPQYVDVGMVATVSMMATTVIPDARTEVQEWKYTTEDPSGSFWFKADFADDLWTAAPGGFGSGATNGKIGTEWATSDIWLRKTFQLDNLSLSNLLLNVLHDDDMEVYINGQSALKRNGFTSGYIEVELSKEIRDALLPGANLIAVHCRNLAGSQYVDVGLSIVPIIPVGLVRAPRRGGAVPRTMARSYDAKGRTLGPRESSRAGKAGGLSILRP